MPTDPNPACAATAWRRAAPVLALALVGALFYLGAQPFAANLFPDPWDKLVHIVFFGGIAGLLCLGDGGRHPLAVVAIVAAVGGLDEWHQSFLPGRSADLADLLTDALAAAGVVLLYQWAGNRWPHYRLLSPACTR